MLALPSVPDHSRSFFDVEREYDRPALEGRRHTVIEEIRRGERALDRYYQAFENGDLDAARLQTRLAELEVRLESLRSYGS